MSPKKLRPLADRLIVGPIEQDDVTPSGLVIPDTAKEKPQQGTVIAVGPGRINEEGQRISIDVSVGDTMILSSRALVTDKPEPPENSRPSGGMPDMDDMDY
jgi:chaperonin GroES